MTIARTALLLVGGRLVLDVVLTCMVGFTHISDDDFARVVIAERFARDPSLDPSGTSWLPGHFWMLGGILAAAGRTLLAARIGAAFLNASAVGLAAVAAIRVGMSQRATIVSAALFALTPWGAFSGAATVPEGYVAPLVLAGLLLAGRVLGDVPSRGDALLAGAALMLAALSRYEAWPACAAVVTFVLLRAGKGNGRDARVLLLVLTMVGPMAWMAWNRHAHGDALHFFERVSRYKRALGVSGLSLGDKLLGYPRSLWSDAPEAIVLGLIAILSSCTRPPVRKMFLLPITGAIAIVAFLVVGELTDGAPTHHPVRALLPVVAVMIFGGVAGASEIACVHLHGKTAREAGAMFAAMTGAVLFLVSLPGRLRDHPGRGPSDRREQVLRGEALRGAAQLHLRPCRDEHFALVAAYGAPERVTLLPPDPKQTTCPHAHP